MSEAGVPDASIVTAALLQVAVEQSFNAVMITNAQLDGEGPLIQYCNAALCSMTGYAAEELIGQSPRMLHGPLTNQLVLQRLCQCLHEGRFFEGSAINYRKNGESYHVEWNISPVRNGQGQISHFVSVQRDISVPVQGQQNLQLLARALNAAGEAIVLADRQFNVVFANEAFLTLTGYPLEELEGKSLNLLRSGIHGPGFYRQMVETVANGGCFRATFINRHKSGGVYYAEQSVTALRDEAGEITHYVGVSKDTTGAVEREMMLREQASRDQLSGLLNRHAGEAELKRCQALAVTQAQPYGLILVDIDFFKRVNDQFGHAAGDRVIRSIGKVLSDSVRHYDQVVRWGGEEFLVILSKVGLNAALESAERIRCAVAAQEDPEVGRLTISLGVGVWQSQETEETLLRRTDTALYLAKKRGRNQVAFATAAVEQATRARINDPGDETIR